MPLRTLPPEHNLLIYVGLQACSDIRVLFRAQFATRQYGMNSAVCGQNPAPSVTRQRLQRALKPLGGAIGGRPRSRRLPRTRGDGTSARVREWPSSLSFPPRGGMDRRSASGPSLHPPLPHTEGWTLREQAVRATHAGFLAHAGMAPRMAPRSGGRMVVEYSPLARSRFQNEESVGSNAHSWRRGDSPELRPAFAFVPP